MVLLEHPAAAAAEAVAGLLVAPVARAATAWSSSGGADMPRLNFTNDSSTSVSAGGTDAPVSGTQQTWTVALTASFPTARTAIGTYFHVADPAQPTELIKVTNVSSSTWTVTRGDEGTTPVAHAAAFTIQQVVSAGDFGTISQAGSSIGRTYAFTTGKVVP
jgi:hypothetical protein